ncbi:MAG: Holliday junction branch migration protein RuvA [Holosporales bacterium]|jgi:Holliday junction DNA helicase RuvA|nr:Holliday junction branch migration protein RuvA [Holosporales bacterium]
MIAKLRGKVDAMLSDSIIIDVCGVGYQVYISEKMKETTKVAAEITVDIIHMFKQEQQYLCGFRDETERNVFKALLEVPGVGVRSAMAVLSALSPEEFALAVANQDPSIICKTHGIGKKTAERILLELKDKLLTKLGTENSKHKSNVNDAILGLVSLGYQKSSISTKVNEIARCLGEDATASDIISRFLRTPGVVIDL